MREAKFTLLREEDLLAELPIALHPPRLDEASRRRLASVLDSRIREITAVVSAHAAGELNRPVGRALVHHTSDAELRVIHAPCRPGSRPHRPPCPTSSWTRTPNGTEPR